DRPSAGRRCGPTTIRAITRMIKSSCGPMFNISSCAPGRRSGGDGPSQRPSYCRLASAAGPRSPGLPPGPAGGGGRELADLPREGPDLVLEPDRGTTEHEQVPDQRDQYGEDGDERQEPDDEPAQRGRGHGVRMLGGGRAERGYCAVRNCSM